MRISDWSSDVCSSDLLGCATACAGLTRAISAALMVRNGPPLAVRMMRRTWSMRPPARHWNIALCSLSTGRILAPEARVAAVIRSPADPSPALLARENSPPALGATKDGRGGRRGREGEEGLEVGWGG